VGFQPNSHSIILQFHTRKKGKKKGKEMGYFSARSGFPSSGFFCGGGGEGRGEE